MKELELVLAHIKDAEFDLNYAQDRFLNERFVKGDYSATEGEVWRRQGVLQELRAKRDEIMREEARNFEAELKASYIKGYDACLSDNRKTNDERYYAMAKAQRELGEVKEKHEEELKKARAEGFEEGKNLIFGITQEAKKVAFEEGKQSIKAEVLKLVEELQEVINKQKAEYEEGLKTARAEGYEEGVKHLEEFKVVLENEKQKAKAEGYNEGIKAVGRIMHDINTKEN